MPALRRAVVVADDGVAAIENAFLITVHAAIFVLVVAGVVLRYVFNDPLTWSEEVIVGLFTWMVFIGAAAAVRSHMHIRIDVMAPVYASARLGWLNALTVLAGVAIIVVMMYACTLQVLQEAAVTTPDAQRVAGVVPCVDARGPVVHAAARAPAVARQGPRCGVQGRDGERHRGSAAVILLLVSFLVLLVIGLPIALAMMGASALFIIVEGIPLSVVAQRVVTGVQSFPLLAIPLFTLAGSLMNESGISERLFGFTRAFVGHIRGGLAQTAIVGNVFLSGISGSSVADWRPPRASSFRSSWPRLRAASPPHWPACATLGPIIPPSILMVVYAWQANISLGDLFWPASCPAWSWRWRHGGRDLAPGPPRNYPKDVAFSGATCGTSSGTRSGPS